VLTIFTIPKAFKGHIGLIQRNAIESWTKLEPRPEIILLGNDEGTMEVAQEFGLRHLPNVATNEHGTPLLSDMFRQAEAAAGSSWMCYVNADIILLNDFLRAAEIVQRRFPKSLMVSKRVDLDVSEKLDFDSRWEEGIRRRSKANDKGEDHTSIDVFAFAKGLYAGIPDFAIGRLWFDHWLIKAVREQNLPVVDASLLAPVFHQNHDYTHVAGGKEQVWNGEEQERNYQLYGRVKDSYTLLDVTHKLTRGGALRRARLRKPLFKIRRFAWDILVRRTAAFRKVLGLRRGFRQTANDQSS